MNKPRRILARHVIVDGTDHGMATATIAEDGIDHGMATATIAEDTRRAAVVSVQPFDGREPHSTTFHPGTLRITTIPALIIELE